MRQSPSLSEVTDEDYVQAKGLWDVLGKQPGQQDNFVGNVSGHLSAAKDDTRRRTYEMFAKVDQSLGARISGGYGEVGIGFRQE